MPVNSLNSERTLSKTVLLTGASSGLGIGMARHFAQRGYNLALCARRLEPMQELKAELESKYSIRVSAKALDVKDFEAVPRIFNDFYDEFGSLEKIVVNAGIGKGGEVGKGFFAPHKETIDVNFTGALAQCEAALEIFEKQGNVGHLVGISSMSAARGMPGAINVYAATKVAFAALLEGIRAQCKFRQPNVRVTTLYPGYIDTPINQDVKVRPFVVDCEEGTRQMVNLIEKGVEESVVPRWPWVVFWRVMKVLPLKRVAKLNGYK
jgi:short-subunit dehydrogenase